MLIVTVTIAAVVGAIIGIFSFALLFVAYALFEDNTSDDNVIANDIPEKTLEN